MPVSCASLRASCCVAEEHKSEEIPRLNPRGQVPTFVDDGTVVNESLAILLAFQDKYPTPSLLPVTIEGRALVRLPGPCIKFHIYGHINGLPLLVAAPPVICMHQKSFTSGVALHLHIESGCCTCVCSFIL